MAIPRTVELEWTYNPAMKADCQHPGCGYRAKWVQRWRTSQMPASAYYYVCGRHVPKDVRALAAMKKGGV